jgi:hypothetical protein
MKEICSFLEGPLESLTKETILFSTTSGKIAGEDTGRIARALEMKKGTPRGLTQSRKWPQTLHSREAIRMTMVRIVNPESAK